MAFQIVKLVTWSMLGWLLYRSLTAREEQVDETAKAGGLAEDPEVGRERATAPAKDDLRRVRGIGPAIENLLYAAGITTWAQLATIEASALREILDRAGPRYRRHDPATWPAQAAELAAAN